VQKRRLSIKQFKSPRPDAYQNSGGHVVAEQRSPSITDEGKRYPDDGIMPEGHPDIDDKIDEKHGS